MRTKVLRSHLIPVNPQNAASNDWVILLEAGTIIGPSPERLRVARSTLERKIVKKYNRAGPGCLNRISARISGGSAGVKPPCGLAAG